MRGALPTRGAARQAAGLLNVSYLYAFDESHEAYRQAVGLLFYALLCYAMLCYAVLCYAMLSYAMLCYAMLCDAMRCDAILCYAMLCYAMLCYAMLCYAMAGGRVALRQAEGAVALGADDGRAQLAGHARAGRGHLGETA
jgi:hypothetical protein